MINNSHTIDATNQALGRLASKVAILLRGKHRPEFKPNIMPSDKVLVTNIQKAKFTGKKLKNKIYYRYTGYPGGIKSPRLGILFSKDPARLFKSVVYNMLPENRQRSRIIKNLEIK